jgi:hypothetical protein
LDWVFLEKPSEKPWVFTGRRLHDVQDAGATELVGIAVEDGTKILVDLPKTMEKDAKIWGEMIFLGDSM